MQAQETKSLAESLASLPEPERLKVLEQLTDEQADALNWDWQFWGRSDQLPPPGDWLTWLILAGRGWGKTRTGSEWVRSKVCGPTPLAGGQARRIAIVAETAADARDVMVEGVTGLLAVHPRDFRPHYQPSKRRLTWPNGAVATLFNAVEPDQLRGPQYDLAWSDELAKWRYAGETWDMLQFGLRLGSSPQQVITTTPKPIPVLRTIMESPDTVVSRGSTYANRANLAPSFFRQVIGRYEGTRLGRQELNAELLEEAEGALWQRGLLEQNRLSFTSDEELKRRMKRIVVALDPASKSDEEAAEHGIIVAGLGHDDHGYVLEDASAKASPDGAARRAIAAYDRWQADRIIGEVNNGGDWIGHTLVTTAKAMAAEKQRDSGEIAYSAIHASRGKRARAEPVSALDEQGRVHHVGSFPELEDQMCTWEPLAGQPSPDRLDARVWALTELMLGGAEVFAYSETDIIVESFPVPKHWPRVWALDMDAAKASVLWTAHDRESDVLYAYSELVVPRHELALVADAIRKRGSWIPGLFDHLDRGRDKAEGARLIDALLDLRLDVFTVNCTAEASMPEVTRRFSTKRLKVFDTCPLWLAQYRAYRRNKDGNIVDESDGLMRAMDLLAMEGPSIAGFDEKTVQDAKDDWDAGTRSSVTGY